MHFPTCLLLKLLWASCFARNVTANLFPLCSLCRALIMPSSTWASKGRTKRSSPWLRKRWSSHCPLEMLLPLRKGKPLRMEALSRRPNPSKPERGRHGASFRLSVSTREIIDGENSWIPQVNSSVLFKNSPSCLFWIFEKETKGDDKNHNTCFSWATHCKVLDGWSTTTEEV